MTDTPEKGDADKPEAEQNPLLAGVPLGLPIGIAIGVSRGVSGENVALGISLGVSMGLALSIAFGVARLEQIKKKKQDGETPSDEEKS